MTKKWLLRILAAALSLAVSLWFPAASATTLADEGKSVKTFHLYATDGRLAVANGKSVYIWGYSLKNEKGTAVFPAPTLEVNEGDRVEVTFTNIGSSKEGIKRVAHTIHFHGLDVDQANDGVPHTSEAIEVGDSFTYKFTATHAGTYFYHCHVDTIEHLQMGMHGAIIVKAKGGVNEAWTGGPKYDKEYVMELNEIDPVWHQAVENGQPYDRTSFHPRYWTINGKSFPDTEEDPTTEIEGKVGDKVLVRLINAGYQAHSMHLHGHHFQVIASDGRPLPEPIEKDTINIGPGERYDILITFTQSGSYPFHSHNITDNTNDGIYPGGIHTMVNVAPADASSVVRTITLKAGQTDATVDGNTVKLDAAPQLIGDTTFVPLRFLAAQLGAEVAWSEADRSVTYATPSTRLQLWIDQTRATVDGRVVSLDAPPLQLDDFSFVPLRFVGERLGATVRYDTVTGLITLETKLLESSAHSGHSMDMGNGGSAVNGSAGGTGSASGPGGSDGSTAGQDLIISIQRSVYMPNELHISRGTTVTWVNNDTQSHTVTDLNDRFDSRSLVPKAKWSYTFKDSGVYVYYCSIHPSMEAKIIVE